MGTNPWRCWPGVTLLQVHAEEKVFQGRDPAVPVPAERHGHLESRQGGVWARSYPCWDCKWLTRLSAPVLGGVLCSGLPLCDLYNMRWKEWGQVFGVTV